MKITCWVCHKELCETMCEMSDLELAKHLYDIGHI